MYVPRLFRSDDRALLEEIMRDYSFATIVTAPNGELFASHAPVLHHNNALYFHLARANEHCRQLASSETLVIFHGPHAYVSPSWYSGQENVPTWNYIVVHARGRARELETPELRELLHDLVKSNEAHYPEPWSDAGLSPEFVGELMKAIAGFELRIEKLEGKLKLSQNREPIDRDGAERGLAGQPDDQARAVAAWMKRMR